MIYLLQSYQEKLRRLYALDYIFSSEELENKSWENLLSFLQEKRVGMISPPSTLINRLMENGYPVVNLYEEEDRIHPNYHFSPLPKKFFERDAKVVARELLGKMLIRVLGHELLVGKIVETEAYYGEGDPASRARKGAKDYNRPMWFRGGHIFVYMVHANWMLNLTTDGDEAQAVLIRAVEPIAGIYLMRKKRRKKKITELCSGPGKLSQSFYIERDMNGKPLGKELIVAKSPRSGFEIRTSHRIGVKEDLEEHLRFFIPSKFVSRK